MVRVKFRYFLLEVVGNDFGDESQMKASLGKTHLYRAITAAVFAVYGDYGLGTINIGLTVKLINPFTRIAYVRVRRGPHRLLATALPFVKEINKRACCIRTLHTSGTLRSCNKFLRQHSHRQLVQLLKKCSSDEDRCEVQASIKSCLKKLKDVIEDRVDI